MFNKILCYEVTINTENDLTQWACFVLHQQNPKSVWWDKQKRIRKMKEKKKMKKTKIMKTHCEQSNWINGADYWYTLDLMGCF